MTALRWIVKYRRLYLAISALLVLLVVSAVTWLTSRDLEQDRELPLVTSLGMLAATIEGGTINSQAMGAAILLGLESREFKQAMAGKSTPGIRSTLDALRRQFIVDAVCLVDAQGEIVAFSGEENRDHRAYELSSWPNVRLAIQGTPNVYPALGETGQERGIYLAAPVRAAEDNRSRPIGAVVVKVGVDKLDMLLESWPDGIALLRSPQGKAFSAGRLQEQFRKAAPDPVAGGPLTFSPDASGTSIQGVRYAVRSLPLEWHDPVGEWRLVVLGPLPAWWTQGTVLGFSGLAGLVMALLAFGLYALARHEAELRKKKDLLREAQAMAVMGSYILDIPRGRLEVSEEAYRLVGVDASHDHSIAGWLGLLHPADHDMVESYLKHEVLERGLPFDKEYRIVRRNDRQTRWLHGFGRLECDAQGRPLRLHGTVQDITERKEAENILRREHEQNQRYLDTTLALMVELDATGDITMVNRATQALLGYAEHELLGRNWFETCMPPEGMATLFPAFLRLMSGEFKSAPEFEAAVLCRDGSQRLVAWRNTILTDATGNIVGTLSSGLDVTESRKLAQQLETILNESPTGIAVYREDGPCIMANAAYASLIGTTREEMLVQNFRQNDAWRRSGLLDYAKEAFETGSTVRRDIEETSAFGKAVAIECILAPITLSGEPHLLLLINDITGRVTAERALNASMHQLEQKELSKTRFLAAAGHDLRQPIAAANLFVDALRSTSPSKQQAELIQRLEQSMGVFSGLLECLLDISKLDAGLIEPRLTKFELSEIFDWLDQNFSQLACAKQLRFLLHFPGNQPLRVHTDIELLKSVLMNLVSNAIKFTAKGGILISARPRGDRLLLQVWDTGIGIAASHLPYIFDEFYQVSNPQRDRQAGLGLGLASCQRRMALLGGKVACRSRLGRGSVFEIKLPLASETVVRGTSRVASMPPTSSGQTIVRGKRVVLVEDDKLVSEAMSILLQSMGAEVRHFSSAEQAMADEDIGDADYFIVDHSLGGAYSGLQFLEFMQRMRHEKVRAVILTGETSSQFLSSVADSPWPVLNKPVSVAQLTARLDQ